MNRTGSLLLIVILVTSISFAQEQSPDVIKLNQIIVDFEQSIIEKDSIRFNKIFFDKSVPFVGIMSSETEASIKKDYPEFEGISVSDSRKFIADICKTEKKQTENFYNILINTDGAIAAIAFDYSYYSGNQMIQWGHETWNLVKEKEKWFITNVVYSIRFPDVEDFPFLVSKKRI